MAYPHSSWLLSLLQSPTPTNYLESGRQQTEVPSSIEKNTFSSPPLSQDSNSATMQSTESIPDSIDLTSDHSDNEWIDISELKIPKTSDKSESKNLKMRIKVTKKRSENQVALEKETNEVQSPVSAERDEEMREDWTEQNEEDTIEEKIEVSETQLSEDVPVQEKTEQTITISEILNISETPQKITILDILGMSDSQVAEALLVKQNEDWTEVNVVEEAKDEQTQEQVVEIVDSESEDECQLIEETALGSRQKDETILIETSDEEGHPKQSCTKCSCKTTPSGVLCVHSQKHLQTRGKKGKYECPKCKFKTNFKGHLSRHVIRKHTSLSKSINRLEKMVNTISDNVGWWFCNDCSFGTTIQSRMIHHMSTTHETDTQCLFQWLECDKCKFMAKDDKDLFTHKYNAHVTLNPNYWYHCGKCPHQLESKLQITSHLRMWHLEDLSNYYRWKKGAQIRFSKDCCLKIIPTVDGSVAKCVFCHFFSRDKKKVFQHIAKNHNLVKIV